MAVTANAMTGDEGKCLEVGMDAYIAKPLILAKLVNKLQEAVRVRAQGASKRSRAGMTGEKAVAQV